MSDLHPISPDAPIQPLLSVYAIIRTKILKDMSLLTIINSMHSTMIVEVLKVPDFYYILWRIQVHN